MTNPSPREPQNPIPERRRRPATGVTFDEMIAIIVAFSTIGTILFWSMGGKNSKLANNFGLGGGSLQTSNKTTDTNLGFGNILSGNTDTGKSINGKGLRTERQFSSQPEGQETAVAYIAPNQKVSLPSRVEQKSFTLDSGAKLVPLAAVANLPGLRTNTNSSVLERINSSAEVPENVEVEGVIIPETTKLPPTLEKPQANIPQQIETTQKKPAPKQTETAKKKPAPKKVAIPADVTSEDWAYPFIKQMSDNGLVSALTGDKNFEPNKLITRASMATLISRAFDMQPKTQGIKRFQDVSNGNEIALDIDEAVRLGFMKGYSENTFRPLENIPRYQVLVALATGLGLKSPQNVDRTLQKLKGSENLPDWAREQVAAAYEAKLIVNRPGFAKNALMPDESATRAEVAAMIHQSLVQEGKLKPLKSEYILQP